MKIFPDRYKEAGVEDLSLAANTLKERKEYLFKHEHEAKDFRGCCTSYSVILSNGECINHIKDACHAALKYLVKNIETAPIYIHQGIAFPESRKEFVKYEHFFHWLFNESPLSEVFLVKDVDRAFDTGQVIRTDIPSDVMLACCVICRMAGEHTELLDGWNTLVAHGMNKSLAFILCHCIQNYGKDKITILNLGINYHVATDACIDPQYTRNFVHGKFPQTDEIYIVNKRYDTIHTFCGVNKNNTSLLLHFDDRNNEFLKEVREKNPFYLTYEAEKEKNNNNSKIVSKDVLHKAVESLHKELGIKGD